MDANKQEAKDLIDSVAELFSAPKPTLGIDIDGCIDVCPIFFQLITRCWPGMSLLFPIATTEARQRNF